MISELEFESFDTEVDQLFREAKAEAQERGDPEVVPDEERVERIVEKARHEAVIKDTTTFFFRSFAAALVELLVALLRALVPERPEVQEQEEAAVTPTPPDETNIPTSKPRPKPNKKL